MRITERDRRLLSFAALHRVVLATHVRTLLRVSASAASARLRPLCGAGLLDREPLLHRQQAYRITSRGLAAIESALPAPGVDLHSYHHDVGVAWLWLAAESGTWGKAETVFSERQLRSHDASADGRERRFAVRLGGIGPGGGDRVHYPDMLLITPCKHRIAFELERTPKSRTRRERILAGYAADPRISAVLYLVDVRSPALARSIKASAAKMGISERVHVQWVRQPGALGPTQAGRVAERTHERGGQRVAERDARDSAAREAAL